MVHLDQNIVYNSGWSDTAQMCICGHKNQLKVFRKDSFYFLPLHLVATRPNLFTKPCLKISSPVWLCFLLSAYFWIIISSYWVYMLTTSQPTVHKCKSPALSHRKITLLTYITIFYIFSFTISYWDWTTRPDNIQSTYHALCIFYHPLMIFVALQFSHPPSKNVVLC